MNVEKKLTLQESLEGAEQPEDQIKIALDFMRLALNQEGSPRLRDFWDAKTACLPLFKQRISPSARSYFWDEFIELSNEARRLKEVLDEQSAFASQQIDLAIQALESDLDRFDEMLSQMKDLKLSKEALDLLSDHDFYHNHYKELSLLTSLSSRIGSLKQEVIKTSMRVRQKGRIFEKLQELREKILPQRKKHIQALSQTFIKDVKAFIDRHQPKPSKPFYALREEIKTMQELSKTLNISTDTFTEIRELLSQFWDTIRALDKDRKKALSEKKHHQKENFAAAKAKIEALENDIANLTLEQMKDRISETYTYLRSLDLHRDSVLELKSHLKQLEQSEPSKPEPKAPEPKIDNRPQKIDETLAAVQDADAASTLEAIENLGIDPKDPLLDPLHDLYLDKKQQALLSNEEVLVSDVEELLKLRHEQKKRLHDRLENLRKVKGAQSLDFEKAIQIEEDQKIKKNFVKTIEIAIKELEDLIN